MKLKILLFVSLGVLQIPSNLLAQNIEFDGSSRSGFRAATSAIVVLASEDGVSTGAYKFKSDDSADIDGSLYKIVGEFPLGDSQQELVPLLELSPAYVDLDLDQGGMSDEVEIESITFGAGIGLQMKFFDGALALTPRFKIDYTEIEFDFDILGTDDAELDRAVPDIDSWSYIPSLEAAVQQNLSDQGQLITVSSRLAYVYLDASPSNSNLADFTEESWVWKNRVSFDQPLGHTEMLGELILRPNLGRIEIHDAARDGLEFNNFYEFGTDLISHSLLSDFFSEIGVGATYIWEEEVQGWRLGFFGSLA